MLKQIRLSNILLGLSLSLLIAKHAPAQEPLAPSSPFYRVMSFNIRYGTAQDEENSWEHRKDLVLETIREFAPDLLGTQETQQPQAAFLQEHLDEYHYIGKSRVPDNDQDEQCAIYFRRDRFVDLEQGHIWLSKTPRVPASKSWDSALPRIATWVRLFDRQSKQEVFWMNTHFDHIGEVAREQSAIIIRDQVEKLSNGPTIITGDFNASESSKAHQVLVSPGSPVTLVDTFRVMQPDRQENEGTFNGFRGRRGSQRIDWILASTDFDVREAAIVTTHRNDRYPSDHFPVTAVLSLPSNRK